MRCWFQHPNCLARTHRNTTAAGEWRPTCVVHCLLSTLGQTCRNTNSQQIGTTAKWQSTRVVPHLLNTPSQMRRSVAAASEWRPTCVVPRLPSTLSRTHTRNANLDQVGVAVVCLYFLLTDLPRNVSFAVIRIGMAIRSKGQVDKAMLVLGPVGIVHRGG